MGIADCIVYAGLDKIPQKSFTRLFQVFGPLPDTLQVGACIFPSFPMFIHHTESNITLLCAFWSFVSGPLLQRSHIGRPPFMGSDLGVPSL